MGITISEYLLNKVKTLHRLSALITIDIGGATMFLSLVEASIEENRPISEKEAEKLLSTKGMSFMLNAYEDVLSISRWDLILILTNLGSAQPYHRDPIKRRLEEGFRSCYHLEAVNRLHRGVEEASRINFGVAEEKALRYLPPKTAIESTVYLTVDAFNPGMVQGGNVGLSILSGLDKVNMDHMAHEFHHIGFMNCLSKRPRLMRRVMKPAMPEEIAIQLICHLVLEGMANHYCTPGAVKKGNHKSPRANEKIQEYEQDVNTILGEIWSLAKDCMKGDKPLEEYQRRTMEILIDKESILPKVHFAGEKIIAILEEDSTSLEEIIDLCNRPENVVQLYAGPAKKRGLPYLPPEMITEKLREILD